MFPPGLPLFPPPGGAEPPPAFGLSSRGVGGCEFVGVFLPDPWALGANVCDILLGMDATARAAPEASALADPCRTPTKSQYEIFRVDRRASRISSSSSAFTRVFRGVTKSSASVADPTPSAL